LSAASSSAVCGCCLAHLRKAEAVTFVYSQGLGIPIEVPSAKRQSLLLDVAR
jgi:hypothetical protein